MTDLSQIPTEDLLRAAGLDQGRTQVAGPGTPSELSTMSTEDLLRIARQPRQEVHIPSGDDGIREGMEKGMLRAARKKRGIDDPGRGTSTALGFLNWAGNGWADEAVGGLGAAFSYLPGSNWGDESFGDRYSTIKKRFEDESDEAWEDHPWAYGAGAVPGFVASAILTPEIRGGSALSTGLKTGAVWGGIGGAGQGDSLVERGINAGLGSVIGGVTGGSLSHVADGVSERIADRSMRRGIEDLLADSYGDEAARRGIRTSRGDRTGNTYTQATENSMHTTGMGPVASDKAQAFRQGQGQDIVNALDNFNGTLAGPSGRVINMPHEGGELLQDSMRNRIASETAGVQAANAADERALQGAGNALELGFGRGAQLVDNDVQAADAVARRVRSEQARSAAVRDQAYEEAAQTPTLIRREAIDGLENRIREDLTYGRAQPVIINEATPRARDALKIISDVTEFRAPRNLADPQGLPDPASITHVNPLGIESVRKRLVALAQQARSAARTSGDFSDVHATRSVLQEFDNQLDRAVTYGLFDGDPAWLEAYRRARSLHAQHRRTYRPDDDLKNSMRAIIERDATPEQVANFLFGKSRLGENHVSAKLADHLRGILGEGSEEWAAIRQAAWQKVITTGKNENESRAITRDSAERIASQIEEFTTRRGSSFAATMFHSRERALMNRFASGLRAMAASERTPSAHLQEMIDIAGGNMNPARVAEILTGGQKALGKTDNSWRLVDAIEGVYGRGSEEWATVRQTVWRQLTANADGRDPKGVQQLASNIYEFVNGQGAPAARKLFSDDERREMQALAGLMKRIAGTAQAKNPPNTASHVSRLLGDRMRQFMVGIGMMTGGADGGAMAFAASQGSKMLLDAANGRRADRLFSGKRDMSVSDIVKDKGDRFLLRQSRRGSLAAPVLGGHELAPAGSGALSGAFADDD